MGCDSQFDVFNDRVTEELPMKFAGNGLKNKATEFKDSGERRDFGTGAVRDMSAGKGRFDLVPSFAVFLISRVFEEGAKKYGERNWEKGIPVSAFVDSAERHLAKYKLGLRDEPHLSMAGWNIMCAIWTACMVTLGLRPSKLFNLPNDVSEGEAKPLSPFEVKSLETFTGKTLTDRFESGNV